MFHVERSLRKHSIKGIIAILFLFFVLSSCIGARQTVEINDYVLVKSKGKNIIGLENLNAFIFENNLKNIPFEQYITQKYNLITYQTTEFWVTIGADRYKILVYDTAEMEKYLELENYSVKNIDPQSTKLGNQSKFIALSMVNSYNEDCLAEGSLYQNIAITYLKKLKDEYYNY